MAGARRVAGCGAERVRVAARWGAGARWLVTGILGSPDVTTVTPSDRADAISSSKQPAAIPTQRSDRALRLLVLGTGDDAVAFRERATQAGAELAQRFSVRVTHVVAEDGVGEQDARVVRARTAGIPVLGLAEGDQLLAGDEVGAGADTGEARGEKGAVGTGRGEGGGGKAGGKVGAGVKAGVGVEAGIEVGGAGGDEAYEGVSGEGEEETEGDREVELGTREPEVEADPHRRVVSLVHPRTELTPEPTEVRPSDVFTGSALEAVLHFPPLRTEEGEDGARQGEAGEGDTGLAGGMGAAGGEGGARSALMDVVADGCACGGDEVAERREEGLAGAGEDAARVGDDVVGGVAAEGAGAAGASAAEGIGAAGVGASATTSGRRLTAGTAASFAWALLPLVSIGLLTPVGIGYAAYRLRSRVLVIATICYTVFVGAAFAVSAASPVRTGTHAAAGELLLACLGASWLGGTVHSFLIRRRVYG